MNYMGSPVKPGTTPLRYVLLHSCLWFRICLNTFHLNRASKFENVPLGYMRSAMSQIRLPTYAVWSRSSLFAYTFIACCRIWSCNWFCLKHQGSPAVLTWCFYWVLIFVIIGSVFVCVRACVRACARARVCVCVNRIHEYLSLYST